MDAIYENGTFWNCWSGDFVALCTKGPDFQQPAGTTDTVKV